MQWSDGLFDLVFTEDHPDVLVTASGDGGVQLWNINNPQVMKLKLSLINIPYISLFIIYFQGTCSGLERAQ